MADLKPSLAPSASALAGPEFIPCTQGGSSKAMTPTQIKTFVLGDLAPGAVSGGVFPISSVGGNVVAIQPVAGIDALRLGTVASGVNYATITPAATGNPPIIGAAGADVSVSLRLAPKGAAGQVQIVTAGGTAGLIYAAGDGLTVTNGSTGLDFACGLGFGACTTQGSAFVLKAFNNAASGWLILNSTGGITWTNSTDTNAPQDVGFKRAAAGIIQVTNGSSGFGQLRLDGTTGAGVPLFGSNSPAGSLANPYTWLKLQAPDGTQVYVPAWA